MKWSGLAAGLFPSLLLRVTRHWEAYLPSSGLLSSFPEVNGAELSLRSHFESPLSMQAKWQGPLPAESLKERLLWYSVTYECSDGLSFSLEGHIHNVVGILYYCNSPLCWGSDNYITLSPRKPEKNSLSSERLLYRWLHWTIYAAHNIMIYSNDGSMRGWRPFSARVATLNHSGNVGEKGKGTPVAFILCS